MLSLRKLTPVQLVMTSQLADAFAAGHVFVLRPSSPRPSSTGTWTSVHNLNVEVASALDLHRRGASLLCCPPIAELGWTRLSEGPRSVGGWEPAQVVKAALRTFLERWQLQPPGTVCACDKCKLRLHREAVMHRVSFHGRSFSSGYL